MNNQHTLTNFLLYFIAVTLSFIYLFGSGVLTH